jgi:hypothetical protein
MLSVKLGNRSVAGRLEAEALESSCSQLYTSENIQIQNQDFAKKVTNFAAVLLNGSEVVASHRDKLLADIDVRKRLRSESKVCEGSSITYQLHRRWVSTGISAAFVAPPPPPPRGYPPQTPPFPTGVR